MASITVGNKRAYQVTHLDGSPLKTGNQIQLQSNNGAALNAVPDSPAAAGSIASGFLVATSAQPGVVVTILELDATGATVDKTTILVDVNAAAPPPATNLQIALGPEVSQ